MDCDIKRDRNHDYSERWNNEENLRETLQAAEQDIHLLIRNKRILSIKKRYFTPMMHSSLALNTFLSLPIFTSLSATIVSDESEKP